MKLALIKGASTITMMRLLVSANKQRQRVPTISPDVRKDTATVLDQDLGLDLGHDHFTDVIEDSSNILIDCAMDVDRCNLNRSSGPFMDDFEAYSNTDYQQGFENKGKEAIEPGFPPFGEESVKLDPPYMDPVLFTGGNIDWHDMEMLHDDFDLTWENSC